MDTLREFLVSTSGHIEPRKGLSLGWLVFILSGLAVLLGTPDTANATEHCVWTSACLPNNPPLGWFDDGQFLHCFC